MGGKNKGHAWYYAFPQRLRALMEEKHVTQQTLADHIGVKRQTISAYADGSVEPTLSRFAAIASFFNVSTGYLLGKDECKTPDNEAIRGRLGLFDAAIDVLSASSDYKLDSYNPGYGVTINALLGTEAGRDLISLICSYISLDLDGGFVLDDDHQPVHIDEILFSIGTTGTVTVKVSDYEKALLIDIPQIIQDLRVEYRKSDLPRIDI